MLAALLATLLGAAALAAPQPALARHVVLSNEDGLTENVAALYRALKAAGHDVVVSVPCTNQSGMGTASYFGRPLTPLAAPCRAAAAAAGDPGAGPMTRADLPPGDFYYVAGTPVMAMTYGVDVVARRRWGKDPDLVLSGPNEGQNVGTVILGSGTVGIARVATARGIPAIAFSAGQPSFGDAAPTNAGPANPEPAAVAARAVELVGALDRAAGKGPVLPRGLALNVNFPDHPSRSGWKLTRVGSYDTYRFTFVDNMARDASPGAKAMSAHMGGALQPLPGMVGEITTQPPLPGQSDDEAVVFRQAIAVTPLLADEPPAPAALAGLRRTLSAFFAGKAK